jgi:4-amino-4-deoxy-L-arabinose transferase-like glycosyltransferase
MHETDAVAARKSGPDKSRLVGVAEETGVEAASVEAEPGYDPDREERGAAGATTRERPRPVTGLRFATMAVLATALAALVPTTGDLGLTWDEPAYRYSQIMSEQWWAKWGAARSWEDVQGLLEPLSLLYYWPYGRFGINFHPPLAGQLNLATYEIFGRWMKDIPARRMATVLEFALTVAIGFHFLARRYGVWTGVVMAGCLLLMPRLYGQAHLIDTDTPGLLLWAATALAFWKGLYEPGARRWRVLVGVLLGLAFIEKMAAVMVLIPLLGWLAASRLVPAVLKPSRADWIDGLVTTGAMLAPLALVFQQIQFLHRQLPPPNVANLFLDRPASDWPGAILAIPMAIWLVRCGLGRLFRGSPIWGVERPALETWTAILAFAPVVGWLGNPAWWRETLPRLAHYYMLNTDRENVLPRIQIIYFGQLYEFSLPWHNAFVLMAITVPVVILAAAVIGLIWGVFRIRRDRLPLYFLVHLLTLPVIRMFPTPAHDGVRLFLPTFFFLAAFAGWGTIWLADTLARTIRLPRSLPWLRLALTGAVLGSSAVALVRIHPYELSYYNELVGGPRGAWEKGCELTYWYDAFTNRVLDDLNRRFPPHAQADFLNEHTRTSGPVFQDQQTLGLIRPDIVLARTEVAFPYVWLLSQDSKATAFTRLLFGMRPWYASEPSQLDGARVASVCDPVAVSRAWALFVLLDSGDRSPPAPFTSPAWVRRFVPLLGRLWGDGLLSELSASGKLRKRIYRLGVNEAVLSWSETDPEGLLNAARSLAEQRPDEEDEGARRLYALMTGESNTDGSSLRPELARQLFSARHSRVALTDRALVRHELARQLFSARPEALVEAVRILNAHRDEVVTIMTRYAYTDPARLGGYLDRDLP